MSSVADSLDKFFRISERGSTVGREIKGGVITFLAMSYILVVNPYILSNVPTAAAYGFDALFTSTALAAIISCILMGIYARFPVALAPGMGVNTFLAFTICIGMGFTYSQGLMVVLLSGVGFFLISITGWRTKILNSIPISMKHAITAGIGFFIAVVGLFNAGIIVHGEGSALAIGHLGDPGVILSLICLFITLELWYLKVWWAVIAGMMITWVTGIIMGIAGVESSYGLIPEWNPDAFVSHPDFSLVFSMFTDFEMFDSTLIVAFLAAFASLMVVDLFDTTGTLIGVGEAAHLMDKDGNLIDGEKALTVDSVASMTGSIVGTSTTTSFIESTAGIDAGARTGLMPIVVGAMFIIALFLSGFFSTFTSACTVGALVMVGILMIKNVGLIEWDDPVNCGMAFMTIFMMGLSGSITVGIAAGTFVYVIGMVLTHRSSEISKVLWLLFAVFMSYLIINQFLIPNL